MSDLLLCLSCGEFVKVEKDGEVTVPRNGGCPECGGTKFKNNTTGEIARIDE